MIQFLLGALQVLGVLILAAALSGALLLAFVFTVVQSHEVSREDLEAIVELVQ